MGRQLRLQGFEIVPFDEPADIVVINTCSVTERADRECRQLVRRALRRSPEAFVAVVGCYAQLQPQQIAAIAGVDIVLGTAEKFDFLSYIGDAKKRDEPTIAVSCIGDAHDARHASSIGFEDRTRAFLKVQDGCDYSCSFCTIPMARGKSRSVDVATVLSDARQAADAGYREIVLTGVNVGDYGDEGAPGLLGLLRTLIRVDGIERIRISSIEPNLLTDELLDLWFAETKLCRHWHVPLQSGSDEILRGMRRRYLRDLYRSRIERIRNAIPNAGIGADVIVGFPGETEELFRETYDFVLDLPVTYLHVFSYSERPNTQAATSPHHVLPAEKAARSERLRSLGLRKRRQFHESLVGSTVSVLFENQDDDAQWNGLSDEYVRVLVNGPADLSGTVRPVRIELAETEYCRGVLQ